MSINEFDFDVLIVAGQSNAEGNGHGGEKLEVLQDIYEMIDINPGMTSYDYGEENHYVKLTLPVETKIDLLKERGEKPIADLSPAFANSYVKAGLLKNGRKLLVVKAALGGTGFALKQWGIGNPLSDRLIQMVDKVMAMNKNNRIVGLLWHQGEHDAFEQENLSLEDRYNFYLNNFVEQMKYFREHYNVNYPIITGGFVDDWSLTLKDKCDVVEKALIDSCDILGNAKFVSAEGLLSNNQDNKNGDNIHFCRNSVYELGYRYFKAFTELIK